MGSSTKATKYNPGTVPEMPKSLGFSVCIIGMIHVYCHASRGNKWNKQSPRSKGWTKYRNSVSAFMRSGRTRSSPVIRWFSHFGSGWLSLQHSTAGQPVHKVHNHVILVVLKLVIHWQHSHGHGREIPLMQKLRQHIAFRPRTQIGRVRGLN